MLLKETVKIFSATVEVMTVADGKAQETVIIVMGQQ